MKFLVFGSISGGDREQVESEFDGRAAGGTVRFGEEEISDVSGGGGGDAGGERELRRCGGDGPSCCDFENV